MRQGLCALAAWISSHPETIDDVCVCASVCAIARFRHGDLDDKNSRRLLADFSFVILFSDWAGVSRGHTCF